MKITIISKAVLAVAVMFSLSSFTSDGNEDNSTSSVANKATFNASVFQVRNSHKIKLAVDKDATTRLKVVLRDKTGKTFYREIYGKGELQYRRVFDLNEMNDGQYYFELTSGDQKLIKEVDIHTNSERVISID